MVQNKTLSYGSGCSVVYKDKLYFYGGASDSRFISLFDCDRSEISKRDQLKFDFVGGTCASNNNLIMLCFPTENRRLCYKSNSEYSRAWWEWFTFLGLTYNSHDSFALSLGLNLFISFELTFETCRSDVRCWWVYSFDCRVTWLF